MEVLQAGIYRLYDKESGDSFVGFSHNVKGTAKRLRFELTLNACSYRPLQEFWNARGELAYELLEPWEASKDMTPEEAEAHLMARLLYWQDKLGENTRFIQSGVIA